MSKVISIDPEVMGGTPVFSGTRVPISTLFDFLLDCDDENPITEFLENFPSVSAEMVTELLEHYRALVGEKRVSA